MSIAERFAANLKRCRQRAGITQAELARRTELDATTVSLFELGKRTPRLDTLVKLTGALDCRADELIDGMVWTRNPHTYGSFEVAHD
ncbi:MAG TPA: helix-turn-helix transcriptional regulator [Solirubrobacterales bacterium]